MFVFFFTVFLTPLYKYPPYFVTVIFLVVVDSVVLWLVLRWSGNGFCWDDRHQLAFIAGELSFFIYACFDHDLEAFRGLSIVGCIAIIVLWQLHRCVRTRI